jgi:hypothetical protein
MGASAGTYGILGALLGYWLRQGRKFPCAAVLPFAIVFAIVLPAAVYEGITERQVNGTAHWGGFLAGLILGFAAARPLNPLQRRIAASKSIAGLALCLAAMIVASVAALPSMRTMVRLMSRAIPSQGTLSMAALQKAMKNDPHMVVDRLQAAEILRARGALDTVQHVLLTTHSNLDFNRGEFLKALCECDMDVNVALHEKKTLHIESDRIGRALDIMPGAAKTLGSAFDTVKSKLNDLQLDDETLNEGIKLWHMENANAKDFGLIVAETGSYAQTMRALLLYLSTRSNEKEWPPTDAAFQERENAFRATDDTLRRLMFSEGQESALQIILASTTNEQQASAVRTNFH